MEPKKTRAKSNAALPSHFSVFARTMTEKHLERSTKQEGKAVFC